MSCSSVLGIAVEEDEDTIRVRELLHPQLSISAAAMYRISLPPLSSHHSHYSLSTQASSLPDLDTVLGSGKGLSTTGICYCLLLDTIKNQSK